MAVDLLLTWFLLCLWLCLVLGWVIGFLFRAVVTVVIIFALLGLCRAMLG